MAPDHVVVLAPGVWRVPLVVADGINAFVLRGDDGRVTLVDAGLPFSRRRLAAALRAVGSDVSEIDRILVTHAHGDHAGGVAAVAGASGAPVGAHERDAEHLRRGESPPIDPANRMRGLLQRWGRYPAVDVTDTFVDGELLDVAGGLRAVHTPGHTPGHTSFLHEPTGTLVTGDAVHFWRGSIRIGVRLWCHDIALNERTVHRFAELDYDTLAFTHGPEVRRDAKAAMLRFLAGRTTRAQAGPT